MNRGSASKMPLSFQQATEQKICPECGTQMAEIDRLNENGSVFVWYKCSRDNCNGQWLQKTSGFKFRIV
jgi:hypothetical protein